MQECFKRDVNLVIFKDSHFRIPPSPTIFLCTFEGTVIGHDIFTDEEKEKYKNRDDIFFLSDDFIIFTDIIREKYQKKGKEYFILPPVAFDELNHVKGIYDVISSSPSTQPGQKLLNSLFV